MSEFDRLSAAQMREAAEVLRIWAAQRQHDAQVAAEVLDGPAEAEAADSVQRVEVVRVALLSAANRRDSESVAQVAAASSRNGSTA